MPTFLAAATASWANGVPTPGAIAALRLIGTARIPAGTIVDGTRVGGLSGLDYDASADRWLAVSDDRSDRTRARIYTLQIDYDAEEVRAIRAVKATFLHSRGAAQDPRALRSQLPTRDVPDCESLRIDPRGGNLWYSSEGDEASRSPAWIRRAAHDGRFLSELPLPSGLQVSPLASTGARPNLNLEGLSFTPDGEGLWLGLEAPLWQDGAPPSLDHGAWTRLILIGREGEVRRQVAYPLDAIRRCPAAGRPASNGVAEILALSAQRLLVLERAGAQQADRSWRFDVRLYEADLATAGHLVGSGPIRNAPRAIAAKRLLADFNQLLPDGPDNLEGIAWGRDLPNGRRSLVLISDDNFDPRQTTECHVFEVTLSETN